MTPEDLMNDPNFKIDPIKSLLKLTINTKSSEYWLRTIAVLQLKSIGLQQGRKGQELESFVEESIAELDLDHHHQVLNSLPDLMSDLGPDE